MRKIYLSDNYVIVEIDGKVFPFPVNHSEYNEHEDHFIIRKYPNKDVIKIPYTEVPQWEDELGTVYSEGTLRAFLRSNTGFRNGGSTGNPGSAYLEGTVNTFLDLPDATSNAGKRYEVLQGSGGFTILGKRFNGNDPGVYRSDGTIWVKLSQQEIDTSDIDSDPSNLSWTSETVLENQLEDLDLYLDNLVIGDSDILPIEDLPSLP